MRLEHRPAPSCAPPPFSYSVIPAVASRNTTIDLGSAAALPSLLEALVHEYAHAEWKPRAGSQP
jgi:hypothetical protein